MIRVVRIVASQMSGRLLLEPMVGPLEKHGVAVTVVHGDDAACNYDAHIVLSGLNRGSFRPKDLLLPMRAFRVLKRLEYDLIEISTPKAILRLLPAMLVLQRRAPLCVLVRGLSFEASSRLGRVGVGIEKAILARFDHRIAISKSLRTELTGSGLTCGQIEPGSSKGLDLDIFKPAVAEERRALRAKVGLPTDANVVIFVGRLAEDKGINDLLVLARRMNEEHPSDRLLLVGGSDATDESRDLSELLSFEQVVSVGEQVDVASYMRCADVLVHPSRREGFGNVLIEAAACGVPQVAYRIPGVVDAVDDTVTGILTKPRDPEDLALAVRKLLDEPLLRAKMSEASAARGLQFDRSKIAGSLSRNYREVLAAAGRS